MNAFHVPATRRLVAATSQELRTSWPSVVGRALVRGLRAVGRTLASSPALWWFGLPWQSHWPPGKGTDGVER